MMFTRRLVRALVALLPTLAGCFFGPTEEPAPSVSSAAATPTSELMPRFSAQSTGNDLFLYARFATKGATFVRLGERDRVVATVDGGEEIELRAAPTATTLRYVAKVPAPAKDVRITLRLLRPEGQVSALASEVVVPGPFSLTSPPSRVQLGQPLVVGVRGLEGTVDVGTEAGCMATNLREKARASADRVVVERAAGELAPNVRECTAEVEVVARTTGTIDPSFRTEQDTLDRLLDPIAFEGSQRRTFAATVVER